MPDTLLSCDWGTTNLRLCRVEIETGRLLQATSAAAGARAVFDAWREAGGDRLEHYSDVVRPLLERLGRRETDRALVISGMASSSIGIAELPYARVPFRLDGSDLAWRVMETSLGAFPLLLLSGVRTEEDVMRGEETQMIGLRRSGGAPPSPASYVLPGSHSKHVRVEEDSIVSFRTCMTGEIFELLSTASVLSASVAEAPFEEAAFRRGVHVSRDLPGGLFTVRTNQLFERLRPEENYWYLSGMLVGWELAELAGTSGEPIRIVGEPSLGGVYRAALEALGAGGRTELVEDHLAQRSAVDGHLVAYRTLLGGSEDQV